jgi:hypothetical protein
MPSVTKAAEATTPTRILLVRTLRDMTFPLELSLQPNLTKRSQLCTSRHESADTLDESVGSRSDGNVNREFFGWHRC